MKCGHLSHCMINRSTSIIFISSDYSVWSNSTVLCCDAVFLLAIVLSVLLRYTDSDYPFDIFKLFLPWHLKRKEMRVRYHLNVHYFQNILRGLYNIDILVVKIIMIHLHQRTHQGLIRQIQHIPTPLLHHKKAV